MRRVVLGIAITCAAAVLVPTAAHAQASIAGAVRDTSGAALPGVVVEASSPALIEKTRTVVTDGAGQYRIIDLSPGAYTVTFTLAGFKTVKRDGIVLEGSFAAQVNADLEVGALEETITVTSESPIVDVVSTRQTVTLNRELLDAIPTPARNTPGRALLLPGTTVTPFVLGQFNVSVRGSQTSDFTMMIDGLRVNNLCGSGQFSGFYMNDAAIQELTYDTAAGSAEAQASGLRVNQIPRDGGNTFSGTFLAYGTGATLQADNRSDEVKAAGISKPPGVAFDYQVNPSYGGPLMRDRLWFYFTYKYQDAKNYVAGAEFANGDPAFRDLKGNYSAVTRLTWQATQRDKLRFYIEKQFNGEYYNGFNTYPNQTPEAATDAEGGGWLPQVKWTQTTSRRLLLEAGITYYNLDYEQTPNHLVGPLDLPRFFQATARMEGAPGFLTPTYTSWTRDYNAVASASYVTGSHAFKAGFTNTWGTNSRTSSANAQISRLVFGITGQPIQAVVLNTPTTAEQRVNSDLGLFAQDSWTIDRLTLNLGVRYDHFNAEVPAQSIPGGPWVVAQSFPAVENVPNWNDWATRTAVSYDLFGDGKTAIKASAGKYLASQAAGYAAFFNAATSANETRAWSDLNGDRTILNPDGSIQFNEIAAGTTNFGAVTSRPDPDLARGYNWEYTASIQHEVLSRLSVTAGYYRREFFNQSINDNLNLDPFADWTPFTFTAPNDPRLPNPGETITSYTLNTDKFRAPTDTLRTYSTGLYGPKNTRIYNGFEVSANARMSKLLAFGSVTTEKTNDFNCDEPDNPNSARFCDAPGRLRTTLKASFAYQLPWDFQLSGFFLARPGASLMANYTVNAAIAGRPILASTAGATTMTVNLIEPNTVFLDYQNQLDLRAARNFRFGRYRAQGFVDVFNVFNSGTVLTVNNTFGPTWMRPQTIQPGAYVRFGTQWNF